MPRATTPTRRPPCGSSVGTPAGSAGSQFFSRRVTLSNAGAGAGGICSHSHRNGSNNNSLPAVVSSRVRGRASRACACSPTTHPGSFRCALHRGAVRAPGPVSSGLHDARRSAMANSLVRIAAVEGGDHVRRALAALVRPSSHHQRRRAAFRAFPSRLSAMSTAAPSPSPIAGHRRHNESVMIDEHV